MLKRWFQTAVILSLLAVSPRVFAERPGATALGDLSGAVVLQGLDAIPSPNEIIVPMAAPAAETRASAGAPAPGRDFSPAIQDGARIKALMKLISDIYNGNHLPYSQDGAIFSNKEGRLPQQPKGYYHEYTLLTGNAPHTVTIGGTTYQVAPDLSARGSERVIIGGGEKIYYTPDHYKNFILLTVVY
ncbi:MAG: hypothetical protein M0011_11890 [Elusimicrobia bacterium]|nr:hypothetical protein [Elusimicrobiota bacterium]